MRITQILLENRNVLNVKPCRTCDSSVEGYIADLADFPQPEVSRWTRTVLRNYLIRDYTGGFTKDVTDDMVARPDLVAESEPWVAQALERGERLFIVWPDERFTEEIRQVQDYLRDLVARRPGTSLSRISVPDAIQQSRQWHAEIARKAADGEDDASGVTPVMSFHDGYQWIELKSSHALQYEGGQMQHCVGGFSYSEAVAAGETRIFSLRDPQGKPHVTVEADSHIRQVKGKQNAVPVAKYVPHTVALLNALKLPPAGEDIDRLHLVFSKNRYGRIHEVVQVHETVPGGNWYYWVSVEPASDDEPEVVRQFYALLDDQQDARLILQDWKRGSSVSLDPHFDFRPFADSVCRYLSDHRAKPDRIRALNRDGGRQDGMTAMKALWAADIHWSDGPARWTDFSDRYSEPKPVGDTGYTVAAYNASTPFGGSSRLFSPEGQPLLTFRLLGTGIHEVITHPATRSLDRDELGPLAEALNRLGLESEYGRLYEDTGLDLWYDEKTERFGTFADLSKLSTKFTNGHAIRFLADSEQYARTYRLIDPEGRAVVEILYDGGKIDGVWPLNGGRRADDYDLPTAEQCSMIATWKNTKNFSYDAALVWMVMNYRACRMAVRVSSVDEPHEVLANVRTLADFIRTRSPEHLDDRFCRSLVARLKTDGHAYVDGDDMVHDEDPEELHFIRTVRIETVPE